jgi:FtsH-binding integral membrane protein
MKLYDIEPSTHIDFLFIEQQSIFEGTLYLTTTIRCALQVYVNGNCIQIYLLSLSGKSKNIEGNKKLF